MRGAFQIIAAFSLAGAVAPRRGTASARTEAGDPKPACDAFQIPKARLDLSRQWQRITDILTTAGASAIRAGAAHAAARSEVELAEFSFDQMIDDLGRVMSLDIARGLAA